MLNIKEISSGYGKSIIIKNVTFQVEEGEFVAIIGPNGAGKTTLFRTLIQEVKLKKGAIFYKGKDIRRIKRRELSKYIAFLPQQPLFPPSMKVEDFLLIGRYPHAPLLGLRKEDRERVEEVAERVGVRSFFGRRLGSLSGGQRQLVHIAQALSQEPSILLLDEPVQHLDIGHKMRILEILKKLNEEGLTVLCILHELNLASLYFNRLLLLNEGTLIVDGTPEEVLQKERVEELYKTFILVEKEPVFGRPYIYFAPWKKA